MNFSSTNFRTIALLMSAWVLGLSGIVFYTPVMGDVQTGLGATAAAVKLTIAYFILGKAISMLLFGPFVDAMNSKYNLLLGLLLFTIGSLLAVLTQHNIDLLLIGRLMQGLGVSLCILMGRSIINDVFRHAKAARIFGVVFTGNAIAIVLLPILAGYIGTYLNWRWIFILLTAYGALIITLVLLFLPNRPGKISSKALMWTSLIANVKLVVNSACFWRFMLVLAFMMAGEKVFTTSATLIYVVHFGMTKVHFGYFKAIIWTAHLSGLIICGYFVMRRGIDQMMGLGVKLMLLAAAGLAVALFFNMQLIYWLAIFMFVYMLGSGLIMATAVVGIVRPFPQLIGFATALAMFVEFVFSFCSSFVMSHVVTKSPEPVAIAIVLLSVLAGVAWFSLSSCRSCAGHDA